MLPCATGTMEQKQKDRSKTIKPIAGRSLQQRQQPLQGLPQPADLFVLVLKLFVAGRRFQRAI